MDVIKIFVYRILSNTRKHILCSQKWNNTQITTTTLLQNMSERRRCSSFAKRLLTCRKFNSGLRIEKYCAPVMLLPAIHMKMEARRRRQLVEYIRLHAHK